MAGAPSRTDLEPLQILFRVGSAAGLTDGQLLERFTSGPEEVASAAFAALVERHGATVRRVCRQILGDPHDADDAAQATFLILARRATSVRRRESVASWLFGVAVRVSRRSRAEAARRRAHERRKGAMMAQRHHHQGGVADAAGDEARTALAEELGRLPERLRAPIIACHLEGLTQEQAASRLRCPLRTLQRRLASGRGRLRQRLVRRGLGAVSIAALDAQAEGALARETVRVSSAWAEATVRAALAASRGAGAGAGATQAAAHLARATIRSMTLMTVLKLTAPALALSAIAALGLLPQGGLTDPPAPATPRAVEIRQDEPTPPALTLTVVDAATDEPLEGVDLGVVFGRATRAQADVEAATGAAGTASITLPEGGTDSLSIDVREDGYVPVELRWAIGPGRPLPPSYTLRLDRGTTIGGRVVDERGRRVAGVEVLVWVPREDRRDRLPVVVDLFNVPFATDADGRWQCDLVPPDLETVLLNVEHPGFMPIRYDVGRSRGAPPSLTIERLREQSAELALEPGVPVTGLVLDAATGAPVAGATVRLGSNLFGGNDPQATTDAEGRFRLAGAGAGPSTLTVQAAGFAPQAAEIAVGPDVEPVTFRMGPGRTIRGRVVGPEGEPVPGASVTVDRWQGKEILRLRTQADADGRFALEDAPDDVVEVQLSAEGYMNRPGVVMSPADGPRDYALDRPLRVAGSVTDAATGEPIAAFTVIPTSAADRPPSSFERDDAVAFRDGRYAMDFTWPVPSGRVFWFEAEGYRPAASRPVRFDEGAVTLDVALERGEAPLREPVSGVVRLPDGSPAAGASVYLATRSRGIYLKDGRPLYPDRVLSTTAGPDGEFRFPPQAEPGVVLVLDDRGFALRPEAELADSPLTIAPWGRVEGEAKVNGAPAPFSEVNLDVRVGRVADSDNRVHFDARDTADAQGRFSIDRVPPGDAAIARGVAIGSNTVGFGPWQPIRVEPGETLELTVGGEGRPVVGRLAFPEGLAIDPRRPAVRLDLEPPTGPEIPEGLSPDERRDWYRRWAETEVGRAYVAWQEDRRSYPVVIDADSAFHTDDVRPGTYILELRLIDAATGEPAPARSLPIEVPEATGEAAHEPLDVGEVVPVLRTPRGA